ncbi:MAG: hypothetical protein ACHQUC_01200 [Chlamydiales bacterium]
MKSFTYLVFTFLMAFSILSAEELPKYQMVDLGVFGTDNSQALAVNEKGQVLGLCSVGNDEYMFLWDNDNGLKLMDLPAGCVSWSMKLNNRGQIAGVTYSDSMYRAFLWDPNLGFWELESAKDPFSVIALNDQGQILIQVGQNQIILCDQGKRTNLVSLFQEQIPGKWDWFEGVSLNNHGHVAIIAYKSQVVGNDTWGQRSFILKDNFFRIVMPEKGWETSVNVICMDDDENMIVSLWPRSGGGDSYFFINQLRNIVIPCTRGFYSNRIINGHPTQFECLPSVKKIDHKGKPYYTQGIQIKKILKDEFPYFDIHHTLNVADQNSMGHIVGSVDTIFSGNHAFLAIPEKQNENN